MPPVSEIKLIRKIVHLILAKRSRRYTNDFSPGPDGLPFSVYRAYALEDPDLAQVLCSLALEMAGGAPPPKGFNYARLHLIPKKTGGLIDDTRSISVTNCDNRLNATVMVTLLQPAANLLVHPD